MVKGISRRVIVVESPDPRVFDQAIFILRNDVLGEDGVSSRQLVDQAVRIAKSYTRTQSLPPFWAAGSWALYGWRRRFCRGCRKTRQGFSAG